MIRRILALVVICVLAGCGGLDGGIKSAIMHYNALLADCYRQMDMNPIQQVATIDHVQKLYYHMAALGEGKVRLVSTLKKVDFIDIRVEDKRTAYVHTKETWDYRQMELSTGKVVLEERDFVYELSYQLIRSGDRWIVKTVTSLNNVPPEQD